MSKKVIFIIGTLANGGAERVVSNLSLNLSEDIEREIILFGKNAKIDYEYLGKIIYLDKDDPISFISKLLTFFKRILKLRKIKKLNNHASFISFLEYPNLINILAGKMNSSIVSVRNFMSAKHKKGFKSFFWNFTIKYLYTRSKKIVVVSNQIKFDLVKNYKIPGDKIKVIYNSYPIQDIEHSMKRNLTIEEQELFDKPTIITAGRLNNQKGQKHLINAFERVKSVVGEAQLVILGEGSLEGKLKEQASSLNISDSVHFLGFQQNPFKYISRSKVYVLTSYYEGFPNALAEAMVCKVPVISTDCPSGPREILFPLEDKKNQYGFLVDNIKSNNFVEVELQISEIILELLSNDEKHRFYSNSSYDRIKEFDINIVMEDWLEII